MKNKRRLYYLLPLASLLVAALVLFLNSCYHGFFQKTATGLQYQVVGRGDGPSPQAGDILLLDVCYKTEKGIVLFSTKDQELPMALPYSEHPTPQDGGFFEAVSRVQKQGDRLVCKLSAEKLFGEGLDYMTTQYGVKKEENIFLHLQLQKIMTEEVYKKWETEQIAMLQKKHQEKAAQQLTQDTQAIASYLKEHKIAAQATSSGLYYVIDTPGKGVQPKRGDKVKVNYTGRFLDGKVFDTNLSDVAEQHGIHHPQKTYEAITFQLGVGQVIQGWDEGIMYLRKEAQARLFIPSTLAYGSQVVGNGLIPANTVLIFDVELVDVQN